MPKDAAIQLTPPETVPLFSVPLDKAVAEAANNRQSVLEFRRRRLEASQDVAEARAYSGYEFNLGAAAGAVQQRCMTLGKVYSGGEIQQNLSVGICIPMMDWGRAR